MTPTTKIILILHVSGSRVYQIFLVKFDVCGEAQYTRRNIDCGIDFGLEIVVIVDHVELTVVFVCVSERTVPRLSLLHTLKTSLVGEVVKLLGSIGCRQHVNDGVVPVVYDALGVVGMPALLGHDAVPHGPGHVGGDVELSAVAEEQDGFAEDLLLGEGQISPDVLDSALSLYEVRAPRDLLFV